jgi:hypothetical protein
MKNRTIAITVATLCFASLALLACGGLSNNSMQPVPLASTYSGTEAINSTTAPVAASLTQSGTQVTGTWGNNFGGFVNIGTLSGTVSGNSLSATITSAVPGACTATVSGTSSNGILSGTFATTENCATSQSGTFTLNSASAPPTVNGAATGTLDDSIEGSGTMSATIAQSGVMLTGTISDSFGYSGQLYGVVVGSNVYFDAIPPSGSSECEITASGSLSSNTLTGTYSAVNCSETDTGSFSMTLP